MQIIQAISLKLCGKSFELVGKLGLSKSLKLDLGHMNHPARKEEIRTTASLNVAFT
jgi:hypothetical protein